MPSSFVYKHRASLADAFRQQPRECGLQEGESRARLPTKEAQFGYDQTTVTSASPRCIVPDGSPSTLPSLSSESAPAPEERDE